jgi:Arc/MetJ-type ribon-helix-helix transcriptional regulator
MADENDKSASGARASRDDRLKSALRENLKRRKAQARERAASGDPSQVDDDGSLDGGTAGKTSG